MFTNISETCVTNNSINGIVSPLDNYKVCIFSLAYQGVIDESTLIDKIRLYINTFLSTSIKIGASIKALPAMLTAAFRRQ